MAWADGRRCAVLGSPIAHSLSPALHRAAYDALGLADWTYDSFEVDESGLPAFLESLAPPWRGLSLTMPLKRAAIPLCDEVSALARDVAAVNTVVIEDDGRRVGTNTDVPGVVAALRERDVTQASTALLLGAGATSGSALAGLAELGVRQVSTLTRDPARAAPLRELAQRLGLIIEVHTWDELAEQPSRPVDVAVSTIPAAAAAAVAEQVVVRAQVVFDVVYDPWPTPLAAAATQAGLPVVSGFDLLVHQAAVQVALMTGRTPAPVAAMRAAGMAALAARD